MFEYFVDISISHLVVHTRLEGFKGTKCPQKDLPCLLKILTWLHVSNYRNFFQLWKMKVFWLRV